VSAKPTVYAEFTDDLDVHRGKHRLRTTTVQASTVYPGMLLIGTVDQKYNADRQVTRLDRGQAIELRAAIDRFLADLDNPPDPPEAVPPRFVADDPDAHGRVAARRDSDAVAVVRTEDEFFKL
jgi:hypothetical protein